MGEDRNGLEKQLIRRFIFASFALLGTLLMLLGGWVLRTTYGNQRSIDGMATDITSIKNDIADIRLSVSDNGGKNHGGRWAH